MTLQPYGDRAVLINFEQKIDPSINAKVITISRELKKAKIPGVVDCIPAYCSITLTYDPLKVQYDSLEEKIQSVVSGITDWKQSDARVVNIPVCYENEFALDMEEVIAQTGLSQTDIIDTHTSIRFQVYMLGFLPGFVYMGTLPDELQCTRKTTPRLSIPPRSVGLAGLQTGIYPSEAPGGWQIIGRTPLNIFDPDRDDVFLLQAGNQVNFQSISSEDYSRIEEEIHSGNFDLKEVYG